MAQATYHERVLVLRKTKLGESDLILTLLNEEGHQIRAVAKGARKPTSSFASRLELFSCCDVLLVKGKSLDIVKEAKLVASHGQVRSDLMKSTCAAVVCELLGKSTESGLDNPRLFPMANAYLEVLGACSAPVGDSGQEAAAAVDAVAADSASDSEGDLSAALLTAGCLVKVVAQLGFRPCLDSCVECGTPLTGAESRALMSYTEGGRVCPECFASVSCFQVSGLCLDWLNSLVTLRFGEMAGLQADASTLRDCLQVLSSWVSVQMGIHLNGMKMLLSLLG